MNSRKRKGQLESMIGKIFVLSLFLILLVNLIVPNKEKSEEENRMLETKPKASAASIISGDYMEQWEKYVSDQFFGRNFWRKIKVNADKISGTKKENGVFIGKSGQLLEDIAVPDKEQLEANINAVKNFAQTYENIPTTVMLVPDAACILSNRLPAFATVEDQRQMFGMVERNLGDTVNWVDTVSIMNKHKSEKLYYKTDHHWSLLGAYAAYCAYCNQNDETKHTYGYFTPQKITQDFFGTMYSKTLDPAAKADTMYAATNIPLADVTCDGTLKKGIYDVGKLTQKDKYAYFFGGNYGKAEIAMKQGGDKKLLVIKDSFANSFVPFLMEDYSDITMLDLRYYNASVQKLVEQGDYDRILILYEMSNFAQDTNIYKIVH